MDLTTLAVALLMALGVLGTDAVMHSNSVMVEVVAPPKMDKIIIDQDTLAEEFEHQLFAIAKVHSIIEPLEIRASRDLGLGMTLAKELHLQDAAYSLQSQFGFTPDRLRFALFVEDGALRGRVSAATNGGNTFRQTLVPDKDETLIDFVHRCSLWGASQLAPYATALYLMQKHSSDQDFTNVIALVEQAKKKLPPSPVNLDRSAFDNLLGMLLLFKNDPKGALALFQQAITEFPGGPVPVLNAAFAEVQMDQDEAAAKRMQALVETPAAAGNSVLLATAYTTWAAAELGLRQLDLADQLLQKAHDINPQSATTLDLWATTKELRGDPAGAAGLRREAQQSTEDFENYSEVAALYFKLAWQDGGPVTRSQFTNPSIVTFR